MPVCFGMLFADLAATMGTLVVIWMLLVFPDVGQLRAPDVAQARGAPVATAHQASARTRRLAGAININEANAEAWQLLPRIGPVMAARIVDTRERRRFRRVTDLMRVKGIGRKTFARIKRFLALEGPTTLRWETIEGGHADGPR